MCPKKKNKILTKRTISFEPLSTFRTKDMKLFELFVNRERMTCFNRLKLFCEELNERVAGDYGEGLAAGRESPNN